MYHIGANDDDDDGGDDDDGSGGGVSMYTGLLV